MEFLVSGADRQTRAAGWLGLHALLVFAFLYLPIAVLVVYSFNGPGVGGFPPRDLTLDWYRTLFAGGGGGSGDRARPGDSRRARARPRAVPGQSPVPQAGPAAADPPRNHYRAVAADAVQ